MAGERVASSDPDGHAIWKQYGNGRYRRTSSYPPLRCCAKPSTLWYRKERSTWDSAAYQEARDLRLPDLEGKQRRV